MTEPKFCWGIGALLVQPVLQQPRIRHRFLGPLRTRVAPDCGIILTLLLCRILRLSTAGSGTCAAMGQITKNPLQFYAGSARGQVWNESVPAAKNMLSFFKAPIGQHWPKSIHGAMPKRRPTCCCKARPVCKFAYVVRRPTIMTCCALFSETAVQL